MASNTSTKKNTTTVQHSLIPAKDFSKHPLFHLNKYEYVIKRPGRHRILYSLSAIAWVIAIYGMVGFLTLNIWQAIFFVPIVLITAYYRVISYLIMSQYPGFNLEKHNKIKEKYFLDHKDALPEVDVFLPICGEELNVIEETWKGVQLLDYPNYKVYVLDDGDDPQAKALANYYGFEYLVRPNRGEFKKAGNLRNGYSHSTGEFVLILDADFIPHKDIINESIPYMTNPKVAIVQTPQYFRERKDHKEKNAIQFGSSAVVEEFYKVLQPSRDKYKAAACVGTSALYRRDAIIEGGGPPLKNRSEDAWERILTFKVGYDLKYIPIILSAGINPETPEAYFKQHNRWSTGSVEIAFSPEFWSTKMSLIQRMIFIENPLYYVAEVLGLILSMQLYILWIFHASTVHYTYALLFVPHLIMYYLILPTTRRMWSWRKVTITAMTQIYTYLVSYITIARGKLMDWLPTNQKTQFLNSFYLSSVWLNAGYVFLTVLLFGIGLVINYSFLLSNWSIYVILFWIALNIFQNSMNLVYNVNYIFGAKANQLVDNLISVRSYRAWRLQLISGTAVIVFLLIGTVTVVALSNNSLQNRPQGQVAGVSEVIEPEETASAASTVDADANTSSNQVAAAYTATEENQNIIPQSQPQVEQSQITQPAPAPLVFQTAVQSGDSMAELTRTYIDQYISQQGGTYSKEQKLYTETHILQDNGFRDINVGENYTVSGDQIAAYLTKSKSLTADELALWAQYTNVAEFN